jgi:PAS domain S-box-containing protein
MVTILRNLWSLWFGTLRRRIIVSVALVQAVMMALFVYDLTQRQEGLLIDRQVEQTTALSQALAVSAAGWLAADNISGLQEIINAQRNYHELAFAMLADRQGHILAHTDPARVGFHLQDLPPEGSPRVIKRSRTLVDVISPVKLGGRQVGWVRVGICQRLTGEKLAAMARSGLFYALAAILACSFLVWLAGRWFTRRLYVVQKTIDAVRAGNRQARIHLHGDDEAAGIAREFNNMLDSLASGDVERLRLHRQNDLILQAAGEGIYGVDIEGRILFANPAAIQMLGYPLADLLGKNSHQLFHHIRVNGSPNPEADCPLQKSLHEGAVYRGRDEVFWAKDGRRFPVEHVNTPILEEGRVIGAVVVFRDISERRQAEDELRLKTARLAEAQRLAHLGHWDLDLGRNHLTWSDEVYRIFGLPPQAFAATYEAFLERIHPEDREQVDRAYRESLESRSNYEIEHRILLPDGEIRYVQERCSTEYDATGTPLRSLGTVLDISERRRGEELLRLAYTVIKSSPTVLFRWQAAPGWPVEYVSENVAQFGYAAADLLSGAVPFASLVHPDDLARLAEEVERNSAAGVEQFAQEYRLVTAGGAVRTIDDRTTVERDREGRVTHYQGIVIDITENKRLESQLRQSQKMEAVGTLAGGIAHDFNNILTAIIGFGEIVMDQLEPGSPIREDQAHVLQAGRRAKDLVKQILTFSRRTDQELQPLLIQFVVKEALKLIRASIPASIEIREEVDVNCGAVLADPGQIHQVVMNLCTNAYQAMRETGGVLTVSLKCLAVSEAEAVGRGNLPPGHYVVLEVEDTGCGMTRAVRERIFEPYFTTKPQGEGTGLGLSLVHGIVTGLGGVINVYSEPGLGSSFKVYLPLIAETITGEAEVNSEVSPGGAESIMLVDDEEVITRLERKILEGFGYRVTVFADSEAALQAFRDNPPGFDLVLTDMTMPQLNGDELAREILRIRPGMPIILCTGFSEMIDAEKATAMGISEFMLKPIEKGELARAVRRALDESPFLSRRSSNG